MRYDELIAEAISTSTLYHRMAAWKFVNSIRDDKLYPTWRHNIGGDIIEGTSMSRNKTFALTHRVAGYTVTCAFDQNRLAQTHRIIPLDADQIFYGGDKFDRQSGSEQQGRRREGGREMAEEFVLGTITPLHRYIQAIYFPLTEGDRDFSHLINSALTYAAGRFPIFEFNGGWKAAIPKPAG